jgi:hypothetical protein
VIESKIHILIFLSHLDLLLIYICVDWESVEINAGTSSKGFSIKNGNFIWTREDGFGGWLGE